jgi:gas vesicle protein
MADNFASYFPVTVTGGTTNPMAGANAVQGQNPQALGLDPILAAIQSQYTPQTFTQSGGSYGAGRFIDGGSSVAGVGSPVTGSPIAGGGNVAQPWFSPGEFNLANYQTNLPAEVAEQVATGNLYGGESASPVGNVGNAGWQDDPYNSLFNPVPGWAKGVIGGVMPGMGAVIGAGQGYNNAVGTNAMNTALGAYGSEGFGEVNPAMAALWGALGITPNSVKGAQTMAGYFDSPESMFGYMAAGADPAISQIVSYALATQAGQTQMTPTAQEVGAKGNQIGEQINAAIAAGKGTVSLSQAVTSVAIQNGIPPSQAAEMGVNAAVASVTNGLAAGLTLDDIDPAAVAAYNDPLGALIDSLGITGKINESVTAATSPINEQLSNLQTQVGQYQEAGLTADQAIQQAIADMQSNVSGEIQGLAASDQAFQQALADLQTGVTGQINTQGQQFQDLLSQYQEVGMTQNQALNQTIADMSSSLTNQVNTQGEQFQTLLSQYQEVGLSRDEALQQALADMQSDVSGLNFATSEDVANAVSGANYATKDDIVNALADLNYTTPEYMMNALEGLNFATPQDITDSLAVAGYATTDELANAIAGLESISLAESPAPAPPPTAFPVTPEVTTPAVTSPVVGEVNSGTSFQPVDAVIDAIIASTPTGGGTSVGDSFDGLTSTIADNGYQGPTSFTEGTVNGVTVGAPISDGGGESASNAPGATDAAHGTDTDADSVNPDAADPGGGGGGGGGKIICTAMNQAYGFGSFRNAIWIEYSDKHLTKAHEVGYHTLFLPLVDYGFKRGDGKVNMIVRRVLEWGTRHRSMDLRAEMRNKKRDTTGKVIRMVFEPLCYVVGKIKGY